MWNEGNKKVKTTKENRTEHREKERENAIRKVVRKGNISLVRFLYNEMNLKPVLSL